MFGGRVFDKWRIAFPLLTYYQKWPDTARNRYFRYVEHIDGDTYGFKYFPDGPACWILGPV